MNDSKLQQFIKELKSNIATLVSLQQQQEVDRPRMKDAINLLAQDTFNRVKLSVAMAGSRPTNDLRLALEHFEKDIQRLFGLDDVPANSIFLDPMQTYEENLRELHRILGELTSACQELNEFDFDKQDPPRKYTADNVFSAEYKLSDKDVCKIVFDEIEEQYGHRLQNLCLEALFRLHRAQELYVREGNYDAYETEIPTLEESLYAEYLDKEDAQWHKALKEKLLLEYDIFHDLDEWQQQATPDMENGSLSFKDEIYLGDKYTPLIRKEMADADKRIIAYSDILQSRVENGYLKTPYVLDLKSNPHLFINVSDSNVSEATIDFVHEYIQAILMSQPSGRVNMCLVDFNDRCKFNRYAVLKNISQNVLLKGIVRNEREIESVLADMESIMFDIGDNKLSVDNAANIFEYNQISVENPQNFHVMVLMDFPEKYSPECIGHIAKIVANGADCGIYTLIVNNLSANVDLGSRKQMVDDAIAQIKRNCIVLHEKIIGTYIFEESFNNSNHDFPDKLKPSHLCTSHVFNKELYPVFEKNAKAQIDTVISLAPFFELSRKFREVDTKDTDFSRLLEIPIGKNGGEVQCLRFFTDSGNAHALVIGGTGSGKSNLLHTIILSACYRYSPNELHIYLVDFKGGVEFKFYQANKIVANQLPHIRLTGLTSETEDGVAILTNIRRILRERENTFRRHDVEDIIAYNEKCEAGKKLPRMLIIIDEVQELMTNQRLAEQALDILGELFKKGRAFGISILWASQTVPKGVGGFKDKVLSQISNRICLKVNNTDDAADLDFDVKKIRALNRPEKGLGLISDGLNEIEFRVAYAENRENRLNYVHEINEHWRISQKTPLFIVGDDEVPSAAEGDTIFNHKPVQVSKSNDTYNAYLGQNYITGDPYLIPFASRGSGEHCWIAGKNVEVLRDVIGYSFLSMLLEHATNKDVVYNESVKFYSYNGELMNDKRDLYCVLSKKFSKLVKEVDISNVADVMVDLYRIRKNRADSPATSHTPIYFFIHQFQQLAELLANSTKTFVVEEEKALAVETVPAQADFSYSTFTTSGLSRGLSSGSASPNSISSGSKLTFAQIFNELLHYGSEAGIHFIMTVNNPSAIPEVKVEMTKFAHKIVLEGVSNESVAPMVSVQFIRDLVPTKEGVAFHYTATGMSKFKTYRYDPDDAKQGQWLDAITQLE